MFGRLSSLPSWLLSTSRSESEDHWMGEVVGAILHIAFSPILIPIPIDSETLVYVLMRVCVALLTSE